MRSAGSPNTTAPRPEAPLFLLFAAPSLASEVVVEGGYRARGQLFESLSLDHTLPDSEGLAFGFDHRLLLRPTLHLGDKARVSLEVRALDGVVWGDESLSPSGPVQGAAPTFDPTLTAPVSTTDDYQVLQDITVSRLWTEFDTGIGHFAIGRMPLHGGLGIWHNDGWQRAPELAEHGDSVDRIGWDLLVQNQFFVGLGAAVLTEGTVGGEDDTTRFDGTVAYRTELVQAGLLAEVSHTTDPEFTLGTFVGSADITLGKLRLGTEIIGQFGGGSLSTIGDGVSVGAAGGALEAGLDLDPWKLEVLAGFATGDGDDRDLAVHTFTYDRDFSVGLVMFEQPLPTLSAAAANDENDGRSLEQALAGDAVSNALFLRPTVRRTLADGLVAHLSWLGARAAKVPEFRAERNSYGMEIATGLRWDAVSHVALGLDAAAFLPGTVFTNYEDDVYDSFDDPVYGVMLHTLVHF